ncbi:MAG: helix-turn-helix domain-containing protein [Streptomyces sp.]|nr:helix-turn-helix domain-containing protein [Streptomyces sp.]
MGRPETPLDPGAGPIPRFADELRLLRREAGSPTYRLMARRVRLSVTALSQAASGKRLPTLEVVRGYAQACGADPEVWERRWEAAAADVAAADRGDGDAPYLGLARFEAGDRGLFFGREGLVKDLLALVREHRFAALLGGSGSGKSSLLRAGLVPRLEQIMAEQGCAAELHVVTPGARPAATHARLLAPRQGGPERWVVVDQFEEVFTQCRDRSDRWRFVDLLLAAREPGSRLRVVIAMRSDFHVRCTEHTELLDALRHAGLAVRPMSRTEIREAIVKPAAVAGLRVERELTARMTEEVIDQPGGLPMLSHALLEAWRRRRSGVLTLAAHEAAGGMRGVIATTAEEVYGRLSPEQARTARRLLLAMITPGEGAPDTRRPVGRAELREWTDSEVPVVVELLTRERLLTVESETVELAHEALITSWPRLQGWIDEGRERLRQYRRLTDATRVWQEHDRDPGVLYRGARLALAEALFTEGEESGEDLTAGERSFLSASRVARTMDDWAQARTRRRTRRLVAALSIALMVALAACVDLWQENRSSAREHTKPPPVGAPCSPVR